MINVMSGRPQLCLNIVSLDIMSLQCMLHHLFRRMKSMSVTDSVTFC